MSNSTQNALLLIRNHLLSVSEITSILKDRVYTEHFYDFENQSVIFPLVILEIIDGEANYGMDSQRLVLHLYTYSKISSGQCRNLHDTIYSNLHAQRLYNENIQVAGTLREAERPISGFNTETRAWFCRSLYIVNTAG